MPGQFKITAILTSLLLLMTCSMVHATETVTGVIDKSGFSGVVIKGTKYNTGRETKFSPSNYRPITGDTVTVSYYPKTLRNGNSILAVSTLTLIKKDPNRKEVESPAKGTIQEIGQKKIRFDFSKTGMVVSMEKNRRTVKEPADWTPSVGDKVIVTFKKVKARFGNNFITIIEKMENVN